MPHQTVERQPPLGQSQPLFPSQIKKSPSSLFPSAPSLNQLLLCLCPPNPSCLHSSVPVPLPAFIPLFPFCPFSLCPPPLHNYPGPPTIFPPVLPLPIHPLLLQHPSLAHMSLAAQLREIAGTKWRRLLSANLSPTEGKPPAHLAMTTGSKKPPQLPGEPPKPELGREGHTKTQLMDGGNAIYNHMVDT